MPRRPMVVSRCDDAQALGLVAHGEEAADAELLPASSNTRAKIRCSRDTPPPVIQCLRPLMM